MKKCNTGKKNITLCIRVPVDEAVRIIGRLWTKGIISDKQYLYKLQNLDANEAVKVAKRRLNLIKQIKGSKNEN